jgi:hypothetical protein
MYVCVFVCLRVCVCVYIYIYMQKLYFLGICTYTLYFYITHTYMHIYIYMHRARPEDKSKLFLPKADTSMFKTEDYTLSALLVKQRCVHWLKAIPYIHTQYDCRNHL